LSALLPTLKDVYPLLGILSLGGNHTNR